MPSLQYICQKRERRIASLLVVVLAMPACVPPPRPAAIPDATPLDSARNVAVDRYRGGTVTGSGEMCYFTARNDSTPRQFQCGSVIIGLRHGITQSGARSVARNLSGRVVRDRTHRADPWIVIDVRPGTELQVIERAYRHPRVVHANLNWSGIHVHSPSLHRRGA
jgi:hypothetical protein